MTSFSPASWFEQLFGFKESPQSVQAHLTCSQDGSNIIITSDGNHASYNAGNFQIRNVSSFKDLTPRGHGTLNIIVGNGRQTKDIQKIDALSSQSLEENDGATYLAASNFNCLEFVGPMQTALDGVTNYVYDSTQGPYVALGCPQSAIYRNYFYEHPDGKIGQLEKEIELLEKTPLNVQHGYVIANEKECERLKGLNFNWENQDNYYVGVHKNAQVLLTRQGHSFIRTPNANLKATHVYAAAFNFYSNVDKNNFTLEVTRHMLAAQYRAAILAAWENSFEMEKENRKGAKKLYLTMIGCGVFENPKDLVANIIAGLEKDIVDSGLEVSVIAFDKNSYESIESILTPVVERTGGKVNIIQ